MKERKRELRKVKADEDGVWWKKEKRTKESEGKGKRKKCERKKKWKKKKNDGNSINVKMGGK